MSAVPQLIKALIDHASKSERSQQVEVGPSELGSCARQMFYKLNKQETTNDELIALPSLLGTAIHSHIEKVISKLDPDRFQTEIEVEYEGLKGHIDIYDQEGYEVIDWKSSTKKNQGYFPSKSQIWQVQVYGYLLEMNGKQVNNVTLVSILRDGTENDILSHTEPFNIEIAREALAWLKNIKEMKEAPAPERPVAFCKGYCPYYDPTELVGCAGRPKGDGKDLPLITDDLVAEAARNYVDLGLAIKALEEKQDKAKATLEGNEGITKDGIKVQWSVVAGRSTIDEAEVLKLLGSVPKKVGKETMRLSVKE